VCVSIVNHSGHVMLDLALSDPAYVLGLWSGKRFTWLYFRSVFLLEDMLHIFKMKDVLNNQLF